ncbi:MAG: M23 family metallopeptidase [Chitinophagales bacterium]|nr:M23 family metallopeptidase [Chitinophagales bacterium]MDW8394095.1 M23 family metallopeptidase [Chitinophagales bacterium]
MRKWLLWLLWAAVPASAQKPVFRHPLDIPIQLSSNFGEIRSDHFHTGYDFRTQGKTGFPVYAAASGFVSRIKVSATGFGKVIYLMHPNGYMTVYAHLDSFARPVAALIRSEQYRRQSFEVEVFPEPGRFPVQQGDLIGYSGNSGTSSGPHLHFEIRDASGESFPLNPYPFLPIPDSMPPVISRLYVYPIRQFCEPVQPHSAAVSRNNGRHLLAPDSLITHFPVIGLGVQVKDFYDASQSDLGVYRLELEVDDSVVYAMQLDRLVFGNGRYVNAHIDYGAFQDRSVVVQKLFREPGDQNSIYQRVKNSGYVDLSDRRWRLVVIRAADASGNKSVLRFRIRFSGAEQPPAALQGVCVKFQEGYKYRSDSVRVNIPPGALYRDAEFLVRPLNQRSFFSARYQLGHAHIPLHQPMEIALLPARTLLQKKQSMVVVQLNNGKPKALASRWEDGWLVASARNFGTYTIMADTLQPLILPRNVSQNQALSGRYVHFTVRDDLTGITSYSAHLNGQWVLMEYDPKEDRMTVVLDEPLKAGRHVLRLSVSDAVHNQATYELSFLKK